MQRRPASSGRLAIIFAVIALVVVIGVAGGGTLLYGKTQLDPVSSTHDGQHKIVVTQGETLATLASDLDAAGLIRSNFWFTQFAKYKGLADHLHPGSFLLDSGMGASAIIVKLEGKPDVTLVRITFAEGMTADQMAATVAKSKLGISADQYMNEVKNGKFSEPFLQYIPDGSGLEGFLFPDTYDVAAGSTAHDLVQTQLDTFKAKAAQYLTGNKQMNAYQLVITASLVEREAKFDEDRPLVAGVINNRLAQNMRLQIDASVLYGIGVFGRSPTADELDTDTPYNTYLHDGLPPTPIANPGLSSLKAAQNPASTDYLFYVSDTCGHNHYSKTEAEHEQAIAKYLDATSC